MKRVEKQVREEQSKPFTKNIDLSIDCLQQAADWLGQYSRILENLNTPATAR